ncbi:hypothetical protein ACFX2I_004270 [Malus domestica]
MFGRKLKIAYLYRSTYVLQSTSNCFSKKHLEVFAAEVADKDNEAKCRANGDVAQRRRGRSRHSLASADFSYEPSSYARNFEDDVNRADEIISLRRFRGLLAQPKQSLTTAPPPTKCSPLRPEIAAFS